MSAFNKVTEMAVFAIEDEQLFLEEIMPGYTVEMIAANTEADIKHAPTLKSA
jgi:acyl CoA:acetate/3-ketoacid CoA transferase beta subunit